MYCSSCGNEIKKGLNYCNSCGARIVDVEEEKSGSRVENVSTAIGFIGIGGIVGFIVLVKTLLGSEIDPSVMVIILLAFLATVFGIIYLLIKQLAGKTENSEQNIAFKSDTPRMMKSPDTNQLEEPKQKPASVVENTTRTLDKVPVERN